MSFRGARVLVVDDERLIRWSLVQSLEQAGHQVCEAADGEQALVLARRERPDIVLLDFRLPGISGMEVLGLLRAELADCSVVMISAHGTLELAVEAMKQGAVDYLRKPFSAEEVELLVGRLAQSLKLKQEVDLYRGKERRLFGLDSLVGGSAGMQAVRDLVSRIARSDASNVLVEGKSGTGKGLVARVIHYAGRRRQRPFVEVSCTALSESLVESELFGHERGAFTDAKTAKKGLFELADGGTIFLDEIGDMALASQAKLLRALEDRRFRRVGGVHDIDVDVCVVAATNRDLGRQVEAGQFRADLFYRLAVLRLTIPPLQQRTQDIEALSAHFLAHFAREFHKPLGRLAPQALERLRAYHWPGNVRELRNVLERALILGDGQTIGIGDLPAELLAGQRGILGPGAPELPIEGLSMEEVERRMIAEALRASSGNQTRAARLLKISRDTLRYRIKKHGIEPSG
jgi:DNA-binding NtrC family response regulator